MGEFLKPSAVLELLTWKTGTACFNMRHLNVSTTGA